MVSRPLLFAMLLLPGPAHAACAGKFASMAKYAGGPQSRLLADPAIKVRVSALMGPALDRLKTSLLVGGPVDLIGCELVVNGNAPHQGGERNAILSFSLSTGRMTAGLMERERIYIVTSPAAPGVTFQYDWLPSHVRDWAVVAAQRFRTRGTPPANVTLRSPLGAWPSRLGVWR